eukprot:gb/GECG01000572.1/.p1 GENE.gb/GECG01000572.1/~~gb/GECG01000572.1/.p1  ORF type:complete len:588 (+),score=51.98 gb/GECG01000572.1/:1-1764(+)
MNNGAQEQRPTTALPHLRRSNPRGGSHNGGRGGAAPPERKANATPQPAVADWSGSTPVSTFRQSNPMGAVGTRTSPVRRERDSPGMGPGSSRRSARNRNSSRNKGPAPNATITNGYGFSPKDEKGTRKARPPRSRPPTKQRLTPSPNGKAESTKYYTSPLKARKDLEFARSQKAGKMQRRHSRTGSQSSRRRPPAPPPPRGSSQEHETVTRDADGPARTSDNLYRYTTTPFADSVQRTEEAQKVVDEQTADIETARRSTRAASTGLAPTIAPGSPVEYALRTPVHPPRKKLHRPGAIKKAMMGTEQYYKEKAEKLQGKIINQQHTLYHLSYAMMVGIYTSVAGVPVESPLVMDDFMKVNKLVFPPQGSPQTEPHLLQETFKMKDYAPKVFHYLRERFGIDRTDYLASLGGAYQYIEFQSNSKSGQFFFFSHDGKFMIKTQTKAESRFLRRIMVHYFKHVVENEGTYLPRFYGMHRLKMKHLRKKVHFVVMHSVFDAGDLPIHLMYDLKGSRHNRQATEEQKAKGLGKCVLKDNDFAHSGTKLSLGPERRSAFLDQLKRDTDFLRGMPRLGCAGFVHLSDSLSASPQK